MNKHERTFTLDDIVGDSTGELFKGTFTINTKLSYDDILRFDRLRRDYLGGTNQENASIMALNIANVLADLAVRVKTSPNWWSGARNGFDLKDDNVLQVIYDETLKCLKEEDEMIKMKKEENIAKLRLKTASETNA